MQVFEAIKKKVITIGGDAIKRMKDHQRKLLKRVERKGEETSPVGNCFQAK